MLFSFFVSLRKAEFCVIIFSYMFTMGGTDVKRRALAFIICFCLLVSSLPFGASAASGVCYIAINDQLPPDLSTAFSSGSVVYVPYTVFTYFHIYAQYFDYAEGSTASLYTSDKQFYFDLSTGVTTDGSGNVYASAALLRNGQVYVPVSFVCGQFGLSWSYIYGTGNGDLCRIKDGSEWLSDSLFLSAAADMMKDRYRAYAGLGDGTDPNDPDGGDKKDEEGLPVYLSFAGLPSDALLDILSKNAVRATFFLSADDVLRDPERLRRMVGEGHALGVLCSERPYDQYDETSELIFEAAHVRTLLVGASSPNLTALCREMAQDRGLVFWDYSVDGVKGGESISSASEVTVYLPFQTERADVRILCRDSADRWVESALAYIKGGDYALARVRETENFSG